MSHQQHPSTTFDKAHELTCQQHRVLGVTLKQVIQSLELTDGEEIPFALPRKSTVLITAAEVAEATDPEAYQTIHLQSKAKTTSGSTTSSVLGILGGYFGYGGSSTNNQELEAEEEADRNWFRSDEDDDDDDDMTTNTRASSIQYGSTTLYHPFISRMCVQTSREKAIAESDNTLGGGNADGTVIIPVAEWETWISSRPSSLSSSSTTNDKWTSFIATLPSSQKQFILKVLIELRYVRILKGTDRLGSTTASNNNNDVILFRGMAPFHGSEDSVVDEDFQRKVALWDLNQQSRSLVLTCKKYELRRDSYREKVRFQQCPLQIDNNSITHMTLFLLPLKTIFLTKLIFSFFHLFIDSGTAVQT